MKTLIREALPEDAGQIVEYTKVVGGETDNLTYGKTGLPITIEQEKEFLRNIHEDKTSVFLVACKNGEILGTGNLSGLPRRMSHRAELGISVRRSYWNHGIGSMILKELINYARANGIEIINLEVRCDNLSAIHLYEKFGFKHIGISPAYFKIDGGYIDFEIMYLDLRYN
ncbi:MAG: GNAT family N-acetyltransferase [Clostridiales bacterium]|nr:GNAT family N-acetyltransferase [Clostridiales bacterium]